MSSAALAGREPALAGARERLPPGPSLPLALQTLLAWGSTPRFLAAMRRRYGPIFTLRMLPWGTTVVLADRVLVEEVFRGSAEAFHAGEGNSLLAPVVGRRSVLVLDEQEHLAARRRLLAPFHGEAVSRFERAIKGIALVEARTWPLLEPFALLPSMRRITFEVILEAVIGVEGGVRAHELRRLLPPCAAVSPALMAMWAAPALARVGPWRRFQETVRSAREVLREEIAERTRDPGLVEREDVLSQLILAGEADQEELLDQLMTLLLAGHETTATALAWVFERLLRHPHALERARSGEREYLDAVIEETLRVRPVIPAVLRTLARPVSLGGYELPAGVTLQPAITLLHRDPELFPEPHRFIPERFLEQSTPRGYSWIPFGGGRRRCPGAAFAQFEMRTVLAAALDNAILRAERRRSERVRNRHITLVPARGTTVIKEVWRLAPPWRGRARCAAAGSSD